MVSQPIPKETTPTISCLSPRTLTRVQYSTGVQNRLYLYSTVHRTNYQSSLQVYWTDYHCTVQGTEPDITDHSIGVQTYRAGHHRTGVQNRCTERFSLTWRGRPRCPRRRCRPSQTRRRGARTPAPDQLGRTDSHTRTEARNWYKSQHYWHIILGEICLTYFKSYFFNLVDRFVALPFSKVTPFLLSI